MAETKETTKEIKDVNEKAKIKSAKIICTKHGDVSSSSVYMNFTTISKDGKKVENNCIYCLACINDILSEFQKDPKDRDPNFKIGKISVLPILEETKEKVVVSNKK